MYFKNIQELESWVKRKIQRKYEKITSSEWGTDSVGRSILRFKTTGGNGEDEWDSYYFLVFLNKTIGFFKIDGFVQDVFFLEEGIQ